MLEPPRPVPATPPLPGTVRFFVDIPPAGVLAGAAGVACARAKPDDRSQAAKGDAASGHFGACPEAMPSRLGEAGCPPVAGVVPLAGDVPDGCGPGQDTAIPRSASADDRALAGVAGIRTRGRRRRGDFPGALGLDPELPGPAGIAAPPLELALPVPPLVPPVCPPGVCAIPIELVARSIATAPIATQCFDCTIPHPLGDLIQIGNAGRTKTVARPGVGLSRSDEDEEALLSQTSCQLYLGRNRRSKGQRECGQSAPTRDRRRLCRQRRDDRRRSDLADAAAETSTRHGGRLEVLGQKAGRDHDRQESDPCHHGDTERMVPARFDETCCGCDSDRLRTRLELTRDSTVGTVFDCAVSRGERIRDPLRPMILPIDIAARTSCRS